jgi:hypothetical protein
VPVLVHVLLLERLARPVLPQLPDSRVLGSGPLRRGYLPPGDAARLQVVPAVADDAEVGIVRLVDPVLIEDHHAEHVGLPEPAQQRGAPPQCRLGPPLLGQVGEDRVGPARPALLIACVGDGGDPHPAQLTGPPVPDPGYRAGDDLARPQRHPDRQVTGRERGAVLADRLPFRDDRPGCHRVQVDAQDLAGGPVRADDRPAGVVVDDPLRHRLEQSPVPLLRRDQIAGQNLHSVPVPHTRGHAGPAIRSAPGIDVSSALFTHFATAPASPAPCELKAVSPRAGTLGGICGAQMIPSFRPRRTASLHRVTRSLR